MLAYQEAINWLYSFLDSEKKLPQTPLDFNLPRIMTLLQALDNPQLQYPCVVVAGTKGKGSTCAMLEAMLRVAGLRVGLFTSPHLHTYRERMQINRCLIEQHELVALVAYLQPKVQNLDPELGNLSTYELGVALGLTYFAQQKIDIAVLEIGLGGRYDAINAVTPLVSIITSISYDHTAILGDTLAKIAAEKAGIIKHHVPVVTLAQDREAAIVIAAQADRHQAPLFIATEHGLQEQASGELAEYPITLSSQTIALKGTFQRENAFLATSAAMLLRECGLPISDDGMRTGLAEVNWPGRFEVIGHNPHIIVDGAHNGASAQVLMLSLQANYVYQRLILVLGTSNDKDIAAIMRELVPHAAHIILTQSRHPRSMPTNMLRDILASLRIQHGSVKEIAAIPEAMSHACSLAGADDLICITGSLFVVAAAREIHGLAMAD